MKTTIEIEIDDRILQNCAVKLVNDMFKLPNYHGDCGGKGYEILRGQIEEQIRQLDFRTMISSAVHDQVDGIVRNATAEFLKKKIKDVYKTMTIEGDLFQTQNDNSRTNS